MRDEGRLHPNDKIYVGSDKTDCIVYFGSVDAKLVAADFTREQQRDFTMRKQIVWEDASGRLVVDKRQPKFFRRYHAN